MNKVAVTNELIRIAKFLAGAERLDLPDGVPQPPYHDEQEDLAGLLYDGIMDGEIKNEHDAATIAKIYRRHMGLRENDYKVKANWQWFLKNQVKLLAMNRQVVASELVKVAKLLVAGLPFGKEHEMIPEIEKELRQAEVDFKDVDVQKNFAGKFNIRVKLRRKDQFDTDRIQVFNACYHATEWLAKKYDVKTVDYVQVGSRPLTLGITIGFEGK